MSRRTWVFLGAVTVVAASLGVAGVLLSSDRRQTLSEASSPDGTWSVAVVGRRLLTGAWEVVVEVRDSEGRVVPGGAFVVDLTRDLTGAERTHAVRFLDNATAKVGGRTLDKATWITNEPKKRGAIRSQRPGARGSSLP
jgi:hypothetical protein